MTAVPPSAPETAAGDDACAWVWRHPRPDGVAGRCIGRADVPVDRRKARRLARRVARAAAAAGLPRVVLTSPLARCAEVGRCLRRLGWVHRIDPALAELDFGRWERRRWRDIAVHEIDAWCADFAGHAPGGGEPLGAMLRRAAAWQAPAPVVVIGHAGWMLARQWLQAGPRRPPTAAEWPRAPRHSELRRLAAQRLQPHAPAPAPDTKVHSAIWKTVPLA